jgi:hypothetical protein
MRGTAQALTRGDGHRLVDPHVSDLPKAICHERLLIKRVRRTLGEPAQATMCYRDEWPLERRAAFVAVSYLISDRRRGRSRRRVPSLIATAFGTCDTNAVGSTLSGVSRATRLLGSHVLASATTSPLFSLRYDSAPTEAGESDPKGDCRGSRVVHRPTEKPQSAGDWPPWLRWHCPDRSEHKRRLSRTILSWSF